MSSRRLSLLVSVAILAFATGLPSKSFAASQFPNQTAVASDRAERLARIEKALEEKRAQLGVPGVALVIVKDDTVVFQKGFGVKDLTTKEPVGPDTLFSIG